MNCNTSSKTSRTTLVAGIAYIGNTKPPLPLENAGKNGYSPLLPSILVGKTTSLNTKH